MYYETPTGVSVHGGFPNPATDAAIQNLDLNQLLIRHPIGTYFMQIDSNQWFEQGVFAGDIAIIDRVLKPQPNDLVVWWLGESFTISTQASMPLDATSWGVVTTIVHQYRRREAQS